MNRKHAALLPALLLFELLVAACSSSTNSNGPDGGTEPRRFATFNTGLNEWVAFLEERRPLVFDALESLDVDVLCLSGVYDDNDADEIASRLKTKLPYVHREITSDSSEKRKWCDDGDALIAIQKCNQDECIPIGLSPGDCITTVCRHLWDSVSEQCRYCLSAHPEDPISCLTGDARNYSMNGRNGMLLLSRTPIQNTSFAALGTMTVQAHFGENYQLLLDAGFEEPWPDRQCTFCRDNPLIRPTTNRQIDHLLVRNCPDYTSLKFTRIFDDPITVTDRQDAEQVTSLAANYGLLVEVR